MSSAAATPPAASTGRRRSSSSRPANRACRRNRRRRSADRAQRRVLPATVQCRSRRSDKEPRAIGGGQTWPGATRPPCSGASAIHANAGWPNFGKLSARRAPERSARANMDAGLELLFLLEAPRRLLCFAAIGDSPRLGRDRSTGAPGAGSSTNAGYPLPDQPRAIAAAAERSCSALHLHHPDPRSCPRTAPRRPRSGRRALLPPAAAHALRRRPPPGAAASKPWQSCRRRRGGWRGLSACGFTFSVGGSRPAAASRSSVRLPAPAPARAAQRRAARPGRRRRVGAVTTRRRQRSRRVDRVRRVGRGVL